MIRKHTEGSSKQNRTALQLLIDAVGGLLSLRSGEEEADGQGYFDKHID